MIQGALLPALLAQATVEPIVEAPINWIPTIAVGIGCLMGLLVFAYSTKAGIIARATTKEAVRQPVFWLCLGLALVLLVGNTFRHLF